ncbi:hypothetical protein UFOVP244_52 [uncultured Caudovirales phage]|uniref:Uncharacterized protein n=1 Tax=uncultured Caudovirales phage TaxID=2100421 RepID=A0A6J7WVM3_9CAUD|nr:hypothetical protein UFOVP244_52 [uncultured Caudovirales phage]
MYRKYWSNSLLADIIRGTKKPNSASFEEWDIWEKESKEKHPYRHWLAETGMDLIQDVVFLPRSKVQGFRYWFLNRFVRKTHALTSRSLKKGKYYEFDTRILHCLFDELANHVEGEIAHLADILSGKSSRILHLRSSREKGLSHLTWESNLVYNEEWGVEVGEERYGKPTPQAIAAKEIIDLYIWWADLRPKREEAFQKLISSDSESYPLDAERVNEAEDDQMLMRLIKVRGHLWT